MFEHRYRVAFYDTDAMGVVHHANYIRIMECARVEWMRELGLIQEHVPNGPMVLGVTHLEVRFLRPSRFDDELRVFLEGRLDGALVTIRYALWLDRIGEWVATGETSLAPLAAATLRPTRLSMPLRKKLRDCHNDDQWSDQWSDQWPPSGPSSGAT